MFLRYGVRLHCTVIRNLSEVSSYFRLRRRNSLKYFPASACRWLNRCHRNCWLWYCFLFFLFGDVLGDDRIGKRYDSIGRSKPGEWNFVIFKKSFEHIIEIVLSLKVAITISKLFEAPFGKSKRYQVVLYAVLVVKTMKICYIRLLYLYLLNFVLFEFFTLRSTPQSCYCLM